MEATICKLGLADIDTLRSIGRRTFFETFADDNTERNMERYLEEAFAAERIAAELADAASEFHLAEGDGTAMGYLKLRSGPGRAERNLEQAVEIERIYVLREFQGRQVGRALLDHAVAFAARTHADHLWLGVWERNAKAIAFYTKHGFTPFGTQVFQLGEEAQTDILMRRSMQSA